jgi:hypothetical protein
MTGGRQVAQYRVAADAQLPAHLPRRLALLRAELDGEPRPLFRRQVPAGDVKGQVQPPLGRFVPPDPDVEPQFFLAVHLHKKLGAVPALHDAGDGAGRGVDDDGDGQAVGLNRLAERGPLCGGDPRCAQSMIKDTMWARGSPSTVKKKE